ncbi:PREDICTED: sororin [Myotis davidii]|nr:PREDICTED: sororin [Myotis davidii]
MHRGTGPGEQKRWSEGETPRPVDLGLSSFQRRPPRLSLRCHVSSGDGAQVLEGRSSVREALPLPPEEARTGKAPPTGLFGNLGLSFPGRRASPPTQSLRRSQRKSGSDLPIVLPEIWPKAPHATPVRKPIVLKKIVAHAVKIPSVHSPRRSPRIAFSLEKENNPPTKEPTKEDLFKQCSVPATPVQSPDESNSSEGDLDTRDLEMSKKVRRSYSRLDSLHCASTSTSTPGRPSCFGFERLLGTEDLAGVSPLVCSKSTEVPRVPGNPWVPDTTLPGISPPVKEKKKKKKVPEILKSELDEWAAAMNAEFEAAEQFDLLVE